VPAHGLAAFRSAAIARTNDCKTRIDARGHGGSNLHRFQRHRTRPDIPLAADHDHRPVRGRWAERYARAHPSQKGSKNKSTIQRELLAEGMLATEIMDQEIPRLGELMRRRGTGNPGAMAVWQCVYRASSCFAATASIFDFLQVLHRALPDLQRMKLCYSAAASSGPRSVLWHSPSK
jgi:hypothetical protein